MHLWRSGVQLERRTREGRDSLPRGGSGHAMLERKKDSLLESLRKGGSAERDELRKRDGTVISVTRQSRQALIEREGLLEKERMCRWERLVLYTTQLVVHESYLK